MKLITKTPILEGTVWDLDGGMIWWKESDGFSGVWKRHCPPFEFYTSE
jgi:hypothetical protein